MWNPQAPVDAARRKLLGVVAAVAVVLAWAALTGLGVVEKAKLPAPWDVVSALGRLAAWDEARGESLLLTATLWSLGRVLVAGVLVVLVGVPVGILMGASPHVDAALSPLVDPFRSAPIVAVSPLLVVWLGIGEASKISFLFLGAVVYLIPMVRDAVRAVPSTYWISARDLGATPFEAVRLAVLPMALPRMADAVIVSVSVMWTYITVAEYFNAEKGLGQLIQNARRFSAMDQVLVGILVIIALALLTHQAMVSTKRKLFPWEAE
jgi:ABC-type nitrate/sulfonate/bicarbonate transport system permease component